MIRLDDHCRFNTLEILFAPEKYQAALGIYLTGGANQSFGIPNTSNSNNTNNTGGLGSSSASLGTSSSSGNNSSNTGGGGSSSGGTGGGSVSPR